MYVDGYMILETLFPYFDSISFDMNASPKRIRKADILLIFLHIGDVTRLFLKFPALNDEIRKTMKNNNALT